jgi:hypothetical protein
MTDEEQHGIRFDRSYWPECGTKIDKLPADLNDLWETFEEQASVFVAEALINEEHTTRVDLAGASVEIYLWSVGGDTLARSVGLPEEITEASRDYTAIRSDAQAEEVGDWIAGLDKITEATAEAKRHLERLLSKYRAGIHEVEK